MLARTIPIMTALLLAACSQNEPTNTDLPTEAGATTPAASGVNDTSAIQPVPPGVTATPTDTAAPDIMDGSGVTTSEAGTDAR